MRQTARRIAEHARTHGLRAVRVDLHGGEPLLGGPEPALAYAAAVRAELPPGCEARVTVQTNGTLLTARTLDRLAAAGVRVGLSLDGGTAALNHRRTDHAGRPSWPAAARAARLLAERPGSWAGVLCAVDVDTDPAEVYHSLAALRPPRLDLLLPHANWTTPPPGQGYGRWLAAAFDAWWDTDPARRPQPRVRLFTEIVGLLLGVPSRTESVGLSPVAALVVDTDGAMEQIDALRVAYDGATATGLDVHRHSFDQALRHPGVAVRQSGAAALAEDCLACPVLRVCGGGNYAHRYRAGEGFRHPSVYCADLERLIRHIAARLAPELPHDSRAAVNLPPRAGG
jgi:uncharacterized protein